VRGGSCKVSMENLKKMANKFQISNFRLQIEEYREMKKRGRKYRKEAKELFRKV
jgi:hypothetical protein